MIQNLKTNDTLNNQRGVFSIIDCNNIAIIKKQCNLFIIIHKIAIKKNLMNVENPI